MTDNTDNSLHEALSALVDGECSGSDLDKLLNAIGSENSELYSAQAANSDSDSVDPSSSLSAGSHASLRENWKRIHLAKAVTQDKTINPQLDLSVAISQAIASEQAPKIQSAGSDGGRWFTWKPVRDFAGKTAIAASVAFAFVAGVQFLNPSSNDAGPTIAADSTAPKSAPSAGATVPQGFELPPLSARTVSAGDVNDSTRAARISPISVNNTLPTGTVVIRNDEMDEYVNRLLYKHAEQSASAGALGLIPYARVSDIEAAEEHGSDVNTEKSNLPNQAKSEYSGESTKED
ncbi:Sigma factor AlgU negative regulatory protein [Thalassocella blandensis]|nr:Sigma factor AlgU negative regulatory protein [Thalassocella blandensis]